MYVLNCIYVWNYVCVSGIIYVCLELYVRLKLYLHVLNCMSVWNVCLVLCMSVWNGIHKLSGHLPKPDLVRLSHTCSHSDFRGARKNSQTQKNS